MGYRVDLKPREWTIADVRFTGNCRQLHFQEYLCTAKQALTDKCRKERNLMRECKWCYYANGPRVVGQGFTDYQCGACGETLTHGNTGTPKLCAECADLLVACVRCGGDRTW